MSAFSEFLSLGRLFWFCLGGVDSATVYLVSRVKVGDVKPVDPDSLGGLGGRETDESNTMRMDRHDKNDSKLKANFRLILKALLLK